MKTNNNNPLSPEEPYRMRATHLLRHHGVVFKSVQDAHDAIESLMSDLIQQDTDANMM